MNNVAFFEIQASDPKVLINFYHSLFSWEFDEQTTTMGPKFWRISTPGMMGGLLRRPAPTPPPRSGTNAFCCSVQVANFDTTAKHILALQGQIALPKFAVPGRCWQGYFIDPDGNTFGIFEADEAAA